MLKLALFSFDIFILNICPNMVGYGIDVYSYFNVFNGINKVQNFSSKYLLKSENEILMTALKTKNLMLNTLCMHILVIVNVINFKR